MNLKTGILAAAAALTLAVPAIASAQPYYGYSAPYARDYRDGWRGDGWRGDGWRRDEWRREAWRRMEREREWRRREEIRRLRWQREHAYRGYGYGYGNPYYR